MATTEIVSFLSKQWQDAGIVSGDLVLIHTSLKRTLRNSRDIDPDVTVDHVLDSLIDAVGSSGTLLLPLFNFDFTSGVEFDIRSTPSQMGALTEVARLRNGSVRTGHPIYSFAALGSQANVFDGVDNRSGYGKDSPFGILHEMGGKIAVLDLPDQNSMTFYHYVEEMYEVPYRYHKEFSGKYTDLEGSCEDRTYSLFVRDLEKGVVTDVNRTGELMWELGAYSGDRPGQGSGLRVVSARQMFDVVATIIGDGRAEGMLYSIDKKTG